MLVSLALLVAVLMVANMASAAQVREGLSFSTLSHQGTFELDGELQGMRVQASGDQSAFDGHATLLRLQTVNRTSSEVAFGSVNPQPGGIDESIDSATFSSQRAGGALDLIVMPIEGAPLPSVKVVGNTAGLSKAVGSLQEPGYVTSSRDLLSRSMDAALAGQLEATSVEISGDFAVAVWDWDFTAADFVVQTGSSRRNAVEAPGAGPITADTVEQVARLTVHGGRLSMAFDGSAIQAFVDKVLLSMQGSAAIADASGQLSDSAKSVLNGSAIQLEGSSQVEAARQDGAYVKILHADSAAVDGVPVQLVDQKPGGPAPGTTVNTLQDGKPWRIGALASFAGLLVVAAVVHGPMRAWRFNRVQRRFDERDYIAVLDRIDSFTRRRRFRRRASFLKAISLLSLESYKEAALYIDTLDARGPDPATRSFLKGCAAAGLGQQGIALEHLSACLSIDPTYREEMQAVPLVANLLPYIDIAGGGSAA